MCVYKIQGLYAVGVYMQVLIVQFGSLAFSTAPLTIDQWLWCVLFGVGDLIWGQVSCDATTTNPS